MSKFLLISSMRSSPAHFRLRYAEVVLNAVPCLMEVDGLRVQGDQENEEVTQKKAEGQEAPGVRRTELLKGDPTVAAAIEEAIRIDEHRMKHLTIELAFDNLDGEWSLKTVDQDGVTTADIVGGYGDDYPLPALREFAEVLTGAHDEEVKLAKHAEKLRAAEKAMSSLTSAKGDRSHHRLRVDSRDDRRTEGHGRRRDGRGRPRRRERQREIVRELGAGPCVERGPAPPMEVGGEMVSKRKATRRRTK